MSRERKSVDELRQLLEDKLAQSALDMGHAKRLGMEIMDGTTARDKLGVPLAIAGVKIPYFDTDGEETEFWRFRYLEPTLTGFAAQTDKKALRYVQPKGSLNQLYLPPLVDWATVRDNTTMSIIITEGELKAACACAHDIPTIGLGGVWCFKSSANHLSLLPQFNEFKWTDRPVYICYDSDAISNNLVMSAENALAKELLNLGARPYILRLPQLAPPAKTGLDDFIVSEGSAAFVELIGTAQEWRASKELFELNEEVVYIKDPGVVLKLETLQRLSHRAFVDHAFSTKRFFEEVPVGKGKFKLVEKSAAAEWLKWPQRAEVSRVTYAPGQDRITGDGELNTWPGWGCLPAEGDISPWSELLDYIFLDADPGSRAWFEKWLAYPLQHPGEKLYTAVVLWGTQHGTGKSLAGYTMFRIYGRNATEIGDQNLHASFNDWAENKQFIMGDEITGGDKRLSADRMKSMITQKQLRVNQKYIPSYTIPDCINYYFTSNHPDSFFIEDNDRRFFIHELNRKPLPDAFYKRYMKWLNGSGAHALFHHLLTLDTSDFEPQVPAPMTLSKMNMIGNGRSDIGSWVAMLKECPDAVLRVGNEIMGYALFTSTELHSIYDQGRNGRVTINGMARELDRANFAKVYKGMPVMTDHGPQKLWMVRPIQNHENLTGPELAELYKMERGAACKLTTKF